MISDPLAQSRPQAREVLGEAYDCAARSSLARGWHLAAVAAPGTTLSPKQQQDVYSALVPVSSAAFGADMTEYWKDRSANDYFGRLAEFVLIEDSEGRMAGWTGHSLLESPARANVYIDSSGVVPSGQSHGVMREVMARQLTTGVLERLRPQRRVYISARSESPVFYKLMRRLVGASSLFPNPDFRTPADVLECGRELASWLGQAGLIEPGSLVVRNAYAVLDELYGELPSCGEPDLDQMFHNSLGPLDAYLLVGRVVDDQPRGSEQ
ncbi:MAG: hypothetical protein JO337_01930 [Acidimicrobiales bacterium]|nr:hypothetical protein [Acidimicrobiales bacterium]